MDRATSDATDARGLSTVSRSPRCTVSPKNTVINPPGGSARQARLGAILALAFLACGEPETLPLRVEYAGCATQLPGGDSRSICVAPAGGQLGLWVSTSPVVEAEITVTFDQQALDGSEAQTVADGLLFRLTQPAAPSQLRVEARHGQARAAWSLRLRPEADWLQPIWEMSRRQDFTGLREHLMARLPDHPDERGEILSWLARAELYLGSSQTALDHLEEAITLHRQNGHATRQNNDIVLEAHWHLNLWDFTRARQALDSLPEPSAGAGRDAYLTAYYRGLLAAETGDLRSALNLFSDAVDQARRVGLDRERILAEQMLGWQLQWIGRWSEALDIYARLEREGPAILTDPCDLGELYNNIGWRRLLALEAGQPAADPIPQLSKALELLEEQACSRRSFEVENVLTNLALAHLHRGELAQAWDHLRRAQKVQGSSSQLFRLWERDLTARLVLAEGRLEEALDIYRHVAELADQTLDSDGAWRAAIGMAQVLAARGQDQEAMAAFERAETLLDEAVQRIPINAGRELFVAPRAHGTALYLDWLLDQDRIPEACQLARRSRSRSLRQLDRHDGEQLSRLSADRQRQWDQLRGRVHDLRQRLDAAANDAWTLPGDRSALRSAELAELREQMRRLVAKMSFFLEQSGEPSQSPSCLPSPRSDEVLLVYHPLDNGWIACAQDTELTLAQRMGALPPDLDESALAERLLHPFIERIARAGRVRVLTSGILNRIDFHALPLDGDVLLGAKPVVYGLDRVLPAARSSAVPPRVLLVADPTGDLPLARAEVARIEEILGSSRKGYHIEIFDGPEGDAQRFHEQVQQVERLHYAGHGLIAAGWESSLALAGRSRFTLNDIFTLERVPKRVVLAGCQTGISSSKAPGASVTGLAQAFLAKGSLSVIAAVREVDDRTTSRLMELFYQALEHAPSDAEAFQEAQLQLRAEDPAADWSSFRVFEP